MNENEKTINAYAKNVDKFVDRTPKDMIGDTKVWLDQVIEMSPKNGKNLEIGCGFGRDAMYMRKHGLEIVCTDVVDEFVQISSDQGFEAFQLNILKDDLESGYDLIYSNAVFEHFTRVQLRKIFDKIHDSLKDGALFAFSVRQGDGEVWSGEKLGSRRFFCLWQPAGITELLKNSGFSLNTLIESIGYKNIKRIYIIAIKTD